MAKAHNFFPNAGRAVKLDQRMHEGLAESLSHIADLLPEEWASYQRSLWHMANEIQNGVRYGPNAFGVYYEATERLLTGNMTDAPALIDALTDQAPLTHSGTQILSLGDAGDKGAIDRYQRMMDSDPTTRFGFVEPAPSIAAEATRLIQSAMDTLHRVTPDLAGEIEALVKQLILVGRDPNATNQFAGGSSYSLWGALFLNAECHHDPLSFIEAIAHESAHSLLFGCCVDEPLVRNPDEDRFPSPLRRDPRPMDGIYHATYVSARMHWVLDELIRSGTLTADETALALEKREVDRRNFHDGLEVVETHGVLTDTGTALMAAAEDYMQSVYTV